MVIFSVEQDCAVFRVFFSRLSIINDCKEFSQRAALCAFACEYIHTRHSLRREYSADYINIVLNKSYCFLKEERRKRTENEGSKINGFLSFVHVQRARQPQ